MFEKIVEINYLFDFYGNLLSEKQYSAIELYYIHDLSLSEISEVLKISRQGVFDTLKRAENRLYDFENRLGLVKKFSENKEKISQILNTVNSINKDYRDKNINDISKDLEEIEQILIDILGISQEGNIWYLKA